MPSFAAASANAVVLAKRQEQSADRVAMNFQTSDFALVVEESSAIKTVKDLKGRRSESSISPLRNRQLERSAASERNGSGTRRSVRRDRIRRDGRFRLSNRGACRV